MGLRSDADALVDGLERLDEDECWRLLECHGLGRVAIIHFDRPDIHPVNYAVDGRTVVFRSAPGTTLTMSASGATAAFEVDEADALFESGASVAIHGHLENVVEPAEIERLSRLPLRTWSTRADHFVRVVPDWVSGRRLVPPLPADGLGADGG